MVVPLFIKIDVSVPAGENGFADAASQSRPALDGVVLGAIGICLAGAAIVIVLNIIGAKRSTATDQ